MDDLHPDEASQLAACLERLAAGDLAARDEIIELCGSRLRVLASRMLSRFPTVRRWDDTDDVFQNAAMRLHRALGDVQLKSPREILALAATQLHRELIDLARHHAGPGSFASNHATNGRRWGPAGGEDLSDLVARAEAPSEQLDRWSQFHEAIMGLPLEQREVFQFVWYLGADQKTIAALLDCSERTVKTRWREAREAVRNDLDGKRPT